MDNCCSAKDNFLFSSESVTRGHPDKLCDRISDSVLDACLRVDPSARVVCEAAAKGNFCMVFGRLAVAAELNLEMTTRNAIRDVGYDAVDVGNQCQSNVGMDYKTATIMVSVERQPADSAVTDPQKQLRSSNGTVIGYATDQANDGSYMPLTHQLCNLLIRRLEECRIQKILGWLRPDGKVQVTVEYEKEGNNIKPLRVHTVLISAQHNPHVTQQIIEHDLAQNVVEVAIPKKWLQNTKYVLNPSHGFVMGGPTGDAGLTGRKIIVDTYGGWGAHGGAALSGKDPSMVERSGAYAARWVAKSLVTNGLCRRAMVQLTYNSANQKPIAICVDSYSTASQGLTDQDLQNIILRNFDLRISSIIEELNLRRPIYQKLSSGGHFGRDDIDCTWEHPRTLRKL